MEDIKKRNKKHSSSMKGDNENKKYHRNTAA